MKNRIALERASEGTANTSGEISARKAGVLCGYWLTRSISQTVSQYAANWQRDHLGDEFCFNYSPWSGVDVKWSRLFAANEHQESERAKSDLSLLSPKQPNCLG